MAAGGPYQYTNVSEATITLPNHNGTGARIVRPGEGFYGPSFYDRYVLQGLLARQSAELVTVFGVVDETDLIPRDSFHAGTFNGSFYELPPHRFQRAATTNSPYYGSETNSCLGLVKYSLSFGLNAKSDDPVTVTYYFYTSSVNPKQVTYKITKTEVLGGEWMYPTWADLSPSFYSEPPQGQQVLLLQHSQL